MVSPKLKEYGKALIYNPNIKKENFLAVFVVLIVLYLIIFQVSKILLDRSEYANQINKICVINCNNNETLKKFVKHCKGSDYWLDSGSCQYTDNCFMSLWELTHIYLHIFIGYQLDLRYVTAIGINFEIYEYFAHRCENKMDIVWNTLGGIIGGTCRYIKQT